MGYQRDYFFYLGFQLILYKFLILQYEIGQGDNVI